MEYISSSFVSVCSILKSFNMLLSSNEHCSFEFKKKNENCDAPFNFYNYPITCKGAHKSCESNFNTITL